MLKKIERVSTAYRSGSGSFLCILVASEKLLCQAPSLQRARRWPLLPGPHPHSRLQKVLTLAPMQGIPFGWHSKISVCIPCYSWSSTTVSGLLSFSFSFF